MSTTPLRSATQLLDFEHPNLRQLVINRGWENLSNFDRIGAVYLFVRDEILFGYNTRDDLPASRVLADGYGQCNTKAVLLMALLRAVGVPSRFHGFAIAKSLQRGIVPELVYPIAPAEILHSWVDVQYEGRWITLEGFIVDAPVLTALQAAFGPGALCGYGVGTRCLSRPDVDWRGRDTFIQSTGIVRDFGVTSDPDDFFSHHQQQFGWLRGMLYRHVIRHWMNRRVRRLRGGDVPKIPHGPDAAPDAAPTQMPAPVQEPTNVA